MYDIVFGADNAEDIRKNKGGRFPYMPETGYSWKVLPTPSYKSNP
jgi:hypothetical protein